MAELKYLVDGVRLHLKEFFYKVTNNLNEKFFISFKNIPDGLRAEKILKKEKIEFKSIPVPDDIFKQCGVAIVVNDYKKVVEILKKNGVEVEVFIRENKNYTKIYGDLKRE